jgi:hypothetical protein
MNAVLTAVDALAPGLYGLALPEPDYGQGR